MDEHGSKMFTKGFQSIPSPPILQVDGAWKKMNGNAQIHFVVGWILTTNTGLLFKEERSPVCESQRPHPNGSNNTSTRH